MKTNDAPCAICGKYSIDCNCGLFGSKENESMESHQERKELYELTSIRDESQEDDINDGKNSSHEHSEGKGGWSV